VSGVEIEGGIVPATDPKTSEGTYEAGIHRALENDSRAFSAKKKLSVVFSTRFSLSMHSFSTARLLDSYVSAHYC
jgi:hypothetical protein